MDWQNDEFEALLRKFHLRESRPLTLVQPVSIRRYRVKIAAAAALVLAVGAVAASLWRLPVKPAVMEESAPPLAINTPVTGTAAVTSAPIPPLPQPKTPSIKLDPRAPEPLKQLTVVIPVPPQDAGPQSKQDSPQSAGGDAASARESFGKALRTVDEKGHLSFLAVCGSCHSVNAVENSHFDTPQEYAAIVDRMVSMGASVSPQEAAAIVDYIFKTYGRNLVTAVDDRGKSVFNVACGACHALDLVDARKGADKETYRSIVNNMILYGASVASDQIDPLVEYLFRTYGRRLK